MGQNAAAVHSVIKAYDVRGIVPDQLDESLTQEIGYVFAQLMHDEGARKIVIGYDMRPSSPMLSHAFAQGVISAGLDAVIIGLISTDGLYCASGSLNVPGAMFTASHNPAQYNGIKLCRAGAKPVGQDTGLNIIANRLVAGVEFTPAQYPGVIMQQDFAQFYADHVVQIANIGHIRPLKIVIDAGNGMSGLTAPLVFAQLPQITYVPLYFELDGTFPNHEANPIEPKNIVDLQRAVITEDADLGLAFDGDADRCFFVDEKGAAISASAVTALVGVRLLDRNPGAIILYNLITSRAVPEIIAEHGGAAVKTRVGHSFIKQAMAQTGAIFGGEHSAHYYFGDFYGADSGMLAALHVISALGSTDAPASQLIAQYSRYAQSGEINFRVDDIPAAISRVLDAVQDVVSSVDNLDGITVDLDDGSWFNLRASNTEPLLRLNAETTSAQHTRSLVDRIRAAL